MTAAENGVENGFIQADNSIADLCVWRTVLIWYV